MTTRELDEKRVKDLCYRCNSKWSSGHKCTENNLFIIEDNNEEEEEETPEEHQEEHPNEEECELTVASLLTMAGTNTPQTLKIEGSIKNQKVMVLIDSGSTYNFINKKLVEQLNCFPYPIKNFPVMIANVGSVSCGGTCHNIKLSMGEY